MNQVNWLRIIKWHRAIKHFFQFLRPIGSCINIIPPGLCNFSPLLSLPNEAFSLRTTFSCFPKYDAPIS